MREDLPVSEIISFAPAIEVEEPPDLLSVRSASNPRANISIDDAFFVSGIQGLDICSENFICAGDFFRPLSSELPDLPALESFRLLSQINLKEMGGGQFRFGFNCNFESIQEEYQVELTILETDSSPWQNKPIITGTNETRIYEGQRGDIAVVKIDSYDFLKESMILDLRTIPEDVRNFIDVDLQPNFLLPYARPGAVKFSQNARITVNSPLNPNDFGGQFEIVLQAKSWIDNETFGIWSDNFTMTVVVEDLDNLPPVFLDERNQVDISVGEFDESFVLFNASAIDGDREIDTPINVTILEGPLKDLLILENNQIRLREEITDSDLLRLPEFSILQLEAQQLDNPEKKTTKTLLIKISKNFESQLTSDECSCETVENSSFSSLISPVQNQRFLCSLFFEEAYVFSVERFCSDFKEELTNLEKALIACLCLLIPLSMISLIQKIAPKMKNCKNDASKKIEEHEQIEVKDFPELKEKPAKVHANVEKRKSMNPLVDSDRTHHKINSSTILYGQIIKSGSIKSIQKVALAGETSFGDDIGPSFDKIVKKSKIEKLLGQECIHLSAFINLLNLKNLTHENILKYHGSFLENNENGDDFSVGIVWDLADQGSLEELFSFYRQNHWKRLTDLTEARFQNWIRNIIAALQAWAQKPIIKRP
ncbi:Oidioi.mRNA.OKI2018_I69.chr1.g574.t3.cds [Oikopleura dioica]|uniref:Oidioi.mRNA.OKI2018_I69.chr1.g574.t3.cds n=1 Tax=Oikopleura dioica TaxID=34765 RepID=A0ABN7SP48_OIKDI|nr:Oidioi.mRNA.OKI2018_I69.chr1.g574.t3.cds [Oikopleura dioica]